ncbi:MAG TPA: hypothetical protein VN285_07610 [Candidatus Deferrimicrobium sp.]|nr:hypothetical protein [Candidatus Deferrimicrobium sp.]
MKRVLLVSLASILALIVLLIAITAYRAQRADYGWDPSVATPTYVSTHPRVVIDQAHNNASTAGWTNRYWPLARLLRNDGYDVRKGTEPLSPRSLDSIDVLVIANASGAPKPQLLGINIPVSTDKKREDPAFTSDEIRTVGAWVERGGSLLLIADHAPLGAASAGLASVFGVKMYQGFVEVPNELSDPLLFSCDNHRLGNHAILSGKSPETAVRRVMTFTGQSLDGPADASVLLMLPASAVEYVAHGESLEPQPAGKAQGLALEYGRGRIVVLGEAAMLTAQVAEGEPFGMNTPGNDNRQLALNIMHWLSHTL